ncbi:hypothetical protein DER29_0530 [Micromonospora sp. M71_S20]|nr:hypothetical protein DER29_0530 [Micromonospora sp. M71_S20]
MGRGGTGVAGADYREPVINSPSPEPGRTGSPPAPLLVAVARGIALVVVVPLRLVWELVVAVGRWLHRWLLAPVGRFLDRWLLRPLGWLLRILVWVPLVWLGRGLGWLFRTLIWVPAVWLARGLAWLARTVVWVPLTWLAYHLIWVPLRWLARLLAPLGRLLVAGLVAVGRWLAAAGRVLLDALAWAWWAAGRLLWWCYALTLRPFVLGAGWLWRHAVRPVGRAVAAAWRATVSPTVRWVRRAVVDPVRQATREALTALGLRG